jgi:hypothetical protein
MYQSGDDILQNPEVVELATTLGFNKDSMDNSDVRKRLKEIWDYYTENGQEQGLTLYCRYLLSHIGVQSGIHPLDVIYTHILSNKLLKK